MLKFNEFQRLDEKISRDQLNKLESVLDRLYAEVGIDVEFSKHFFDRLNDKRNDRPITFEEIARIFKSAYDKYKDIFEKRGNSLKMTDDDWQAVIKHVNNNINVPVVLQWDRRNKEIDMVAKTVMRKRGFKTSNRVLKIGK